MKIKDNNPWYFTIVKNKALEDNRLDTYDKLTYVILSKFTNIKTNQCYPSLKTLKKLVRCSKPRLIKSLNNLIKRGYIRKERRQTEYGDTSNLYTILDLNQSGFKSNFDLLEGVKEKNRGSKRDLSKKEPINNYNNKYTPQLELEYQTIAAYILKQTANKSLTKLELLKDDLKNYEANVIKKAVKLALASQHNKDNSKINIYSYQFIRSFIDQAENLLKGGQDDGEGDSIISPREQRWLKDPELKEYELSEIEL